MNPIIAGHELRAADLPDIEPDLAAIAAIEADELHALDLTQERIDRELAELAAYGALDELAARRHRRAVNDALTDLAEAANLREVSTA